MNRSKALRFARIASVATAAALSFGAFAADNKNLQVTANVPGVCKLTSVPAMTFTLDPSAASTVDGAATSKVEYKCTMDTAPTSFSVGGTSGTGAQTYSNELTGDVTGAKMGYTIKWTAPTTKGNGFGTGSTATEVLLTGAIPNAQYANAPADAYRQTVAIVINN